MTIWKPHLIRAKLIEKSKTMGLRLPQMQTLLAQERFLARLFSLEEGRFFVWKGGSLLIREYSTLEIPRFTVDIDLLLRGADFKNTLGTLERASALNLGDGFEFAGIEVTPMERETPYGGSRFEIHWKMFGKPNSAALRLDVCSGDVVNPVSKDFSELSLVPEEDSVLTAQIYPAEFIFAEKLETLFRFGTGSTRCKDLIDLWSLSKLDLNPDKLKASVKACFENRQQALSLERLRTILENDYSAIRNITRLAEANFGSLKLPPIPQLMSEILDHCETTLS